MSGENIQYDRFPSEIIADEYLHSDNKDGCVCIFSDENHGIILEDAKIALTRCGFIISDENEFGIDSREQVLEIIDGIIEKNHSSKTCFLLLFLGTIKGDEEYKTKSGDTILGAEIWRKIMSCETLKYRPKICIFEGFKKISYDKIDVVSYTRTSMTEPIEPPKYDIPVESDMLVVYKKTEAPTADSTYFKNLWKNIDEFGCRDDLTNIIAFTKRDPNDNHHPITVCTLRKKFYITSGEFRSHYHDINKNTEEMLGAIEGLQKKIFELTATVQNGNCNSNYTSVGPSEISDVDGIGKTKAKALAKKNRYSHIKSRVNSFR